MSTSSRALVLTLLGALALPAAPALGQQVPLPAPAPGPRPVPPPPALGGRMLPPIQPKAAPPVETIDDPSAAIVIDGEKIGRDAFGLALMEEYGDSFLEPFVSSWLIERRAKQLKVEVPAAEVEAATEKQKHDLLEKRYKGDEGQLRAALAQSGLTIESWSESLRRRTRRDLLTKAVVRADRDVSEAALRKEFETRYGPGGVKRVGRYIFLSTLVWTSNLYTQAEFEKERPAIEAEARKRAEAARASIAGGKDFAAVARAESEDPMAEKGGDYGRYWRNRFGPEADTKLSTLKQGEVSDVIQTPRGFIIAKATGTQEGWEFTARHILFSTQLSGMTTPELKARKLADAKAAAEKAIADLKAKTATFEQLATEKSDDPRSKSRGGDLGKFESGSMVPEFEAACVALKDGELSGPVETPYGVHVIQLTEKKRKPEKDNQLMSVILFSTEYLKVKERKLKGTIEQKAKTLADELVAKLKAGADGAELAKAHSDDLATKETGGEIHDPLGPARASTPEMVAAFEGLKTPGEVTVVKGERGYHILKLEKVEQSEFATAQAALTKELKEKEPSPIEMREYRDKLRAGVKVQKSKY